LASGRKKEADEEADEDPGRWKMEDGRWTKEAKDVGVADVRHGEQSAESGDLAGVGQEADEGPGSWKIEGHGRWTKEAKDVGGADVRHGEQSAESGDSAGDDAAEEDHRLAAEKARAVDTETAEQLFPSEVADEGEIERGGDAHASASSSLRELAQDFGKMDELYTDAASKVWTDKDAQKPNFIVETGRKWLDEAQTFMKTAKDMRDHAGTVYNELVSTHTILAEKQMNTFPQEVSKLAPVYAAQDKLAKGLQESRGNEKSVEEDAKVAS
jgi:hypothetical protein